MTSGEVVTSLTGHQAGCGISGLAASTIGLWSASFDCSVTSQIFSPALNVWQVRLWGRGEGGYTCLAVLSGHKHPIRCLAVDSARWFLIIIIDQTISCRLVSGDYRGFVMIWEMEEIKEELLSLERRVKSLPKDKWVHSLHLGTLYLSKVIFVTSHNLPRKERRSEGIYFIRPGSRLVQLQGRTDVAEVMFELVFEQSQLKNKIYIFLISTLYIQVVQHSSLLEHSGNVTALSLSGKEILISGSRDRLVISFVDNAWMVLIVFDFRTINIHQFTGRKKPKIKERKSYLWREKQQHKCFIGEFNKNNGSGWINRLE